MTPPQRLLVIATRRLGDVFLTTPLIHSIKRHWPSVSIHVLVFASTAEILRRNRDIDKIIEIAERPSLKEQLALLFRIARRYDIALSTLPGDRPTIYAWVAGKWRAGLLDASTKSKWKRRLLSRWVEFDNLDTHTVLMGLRLLDLLTVPRSYTPVIAWNTNDADFVHRLLSVPISEKPYAVIHAYPKYNYKMWRPEAWEALAQWLMLQGLRVVLTGSNDATEIDYLMRVACRMPSGTINAGGKLTLSQSAYLIKRARIYIGPDTALTHIAAAIGTPTIALFGPSNPVKWGPWPNGFNENRNPWTRLGSQVVGNVSLIQGRGACVPCLQEGCDRTTDSFSDCLQLLPAQTVITLAGEMLTDATTRSTQ